MQTIHPHNPRLMLAFGTALLCALVLLLALLHGGSLSLGAGGGHPSGSPTASRSALPSTTASALRPGWWRQPLALPFHPLRSPWPAPAGSRLGS